MPKKPTKPAIPAPVFRSTRDLGAALGVSHVTVAGWMKDDRWKHLFPEEFPIPKALLPAIDAWRNDVLRSANEPGANAITDLKQLGIKTQAEVQKIVEQTKRIRAERLREEKQYHRSDDCKARRAQMWFTLKNHFRSIPPALPFAEDVKKFIGGRIDETIRSVPQLNEDAMSYLDLCRGDIEAATAACRKRWVKLSKIDPDAMLADLLLAFEEVVKKRCA